MNGSQLGTMMVVDGTVVTVSDFIIEVSRLPQYPVVRASFVCYVVNVNQNQRDARGRIFFHLCSYKNNKTFKHCRR